MYDDIIRIIIAITVAAMILKWTWTVTDIVRNWTSGRWITTLTATSSTLLEHIVTTWTGNHKAEINHDHTKELIDTVLDRGTSTLREVVEILSPIKRDIPICLTDAHPTLTKRTSVTNADKDKDVASPRGDPSGRESPVMVESETTRRAST
jgi:hypothetical protein